MQVILIDNVANLGKVGDIVNVKEGYARNFLLPQRIAQRATETAIAAFEQRRAELEKIAAEKLAKAQSVSAQMQGLTVQITSKAGFDGRLFGSVTAYDIVEALSQQGFKVEKNQIRMPNGPLKIVGDHPVTVALHSEVITELTISVLGEQA